MKRLILLLMLLMVVTAEAKTRDVLVADFRKMTLDMSSSTAGLTWPDSVVEYYLSVALDEASSSSMAFLVTDTLPCTTKVTRYYPSRSILKPRYLQTLTQDSIALGVPFVKLEDIWLKPEHEQAYSVSDSAVFVTQRVSEKWKVIFSYVGRAAPMDSGAANCELPDVLEAPLVRKAAALAFIGTRIPSLVEAGLAYDKLAEQRFSLYRASNVLYPTDSLALLR